MITYYIATTDLPECTCITDPNNARLYKDKVYYFRL